MLEAVAEFLSSNSSALTGVTLGAGSIAAAHQYRKHRASYEDTLENPPDNWEDEVREIYSNMSDRIDSGEGFEYQKKAEIFKGLILPQKSGREKALKQIGHEEDIIEEFPMLEEIYRRGLYDDHPSVY